MSVRIVLDYDFNTPPNGSGLYVVRGVDILSTPPDLVAFGDSECRADGEVVGTYHGPLGHLFYLVSRTSVVRCIDTTHRPVR
jgi:hypothetical protein